MRAASRSIPDPAPHAIIILDWPAFCRLLDQHRADQSLADEPYQSAQREWQAVSPAPMPAFAELLPHGRGFNVLHYSPALEQWLKHWEIPCTRFHSRSSSDLPDQLHQAA